jgi:hypothetical protein
MKINDYKNILNKNDIYLFDSYYRITYFRLNKMTKQNVQKGGSINKKNIIHNLNSNQLSILVSSLLDNNETRINFILSNY